MHSESTDEPQWTAWDFFASLLLSESVIDGDRGASGDAESVVIELLSSPQACLM